eukprot:COSAG01_NODE_1259_length_11009_cov_53.138930_12_plen_253_part_00
MPQLFLSRDLRQHAATGFDPQRGHAQDGVRRRGGRDVGLRLPPDTPALLCEAPSHCEWGQAERQPRRPAVCPTCASLLISRPNPATLALLRVGSGGCNLITQTHSIAAGYAASRWKYQPSGRCPWRSTNREPRHELLLLLLLLLPACRQLPCPCVLFCLRSRTFYATRPLATACVINGCLGLGKRMSQSQLAVKRCIVVDYPVATASLRDTVHQVLLDSSGMRVSAPVWPPAHPVARTQPRITSAVDTRPGR